MFAAKVHRFYNNIKIGLNDGKFDNKEYRAGSGR